jgi:hypothetical protein
MLWIGQSRNACRMKFFHFQIHPDVLWSQHSLYPNGCRGCFRGVKRPEYDGNHLPLPRAEVETSCNYISTDTSVTIWQAWYKLLAYISYTVPLCPCTIGQNICSLFYFLKKLLLRDVYKVLQIYKFPSHQQRFLLSLWCCPIALVLLKTCVILRVTQN